MEFLLMEYGEVLEEARLLERRAWRVFSTYLASVLTTSIVIAQFSLWNYVVYIGSVLALAGGFVAFTFYRARLLILVNVERLGEIESTAQVLTGENRIGRRWDVEEYHRLRDLAKKQFFKGGPMSFTTILISVLLALVWAGAALLSLARKDAPFLEGLVHGFAFGLAVGIVGSAAVWLLREIRRSSTEKGL